MPWIRCATSARLATKNCTLSSDPSLCKDLLEFSRLQSSRIGRRCKDRGQRRSVWPNCLTHASGDDVNDMWMLIKTIMCGSWVAGRGRAMPFIWYPVISGGLLISILAILGPTASPSSGGTAGGGLVLLLLCLVTMVLLPCHPNHSPWFVHDEDGKLITGEPSPNSSP
jgi:hypothetical protein